MDLKEELTLLRTSAGLYEPAGAGHLRSAGPDAASFLQRLVTNEVVKCPVGEGRHNALLDRKGMVLSLFYLHRLSADSFHVVTPQQLTGKTLALFRKYKVTEKLTIEEVSENWEWVRVIGAKAEKVAVEGGFSWRDDFYKLPVWNIVCPKGERPYLPFPTISKTCFDLLRIESGIPEYGTDIDETHILLEANLSHCYKRQKGCYPGQEVIERILAYGKGRTPRQIVTLYVEGKREISVSAYDPLQNRTLVMATVERKELESAKGPIQIGNNILRLLQPD